MGQDSDLKNTNTAFYVLSNLKSERDTVGCLHYEDYTSLIESNLRYEQEDENGNEDPLNESTTIQNLDSAINQEIPEILGAGPSCNPIEEIPHSTQIRAYSCRFCKDTFPLRMDYEGHFIIHTGEKPYECGTCKIDFSCYSSLVDHVRTHPKEPDREKSSSLKPALKNHKTFERPFKCVTCGMRFIGKQYLKKHELCHTSNKSFKCRLCGMDFHFSDELKVHRVIHTENKEKSYKCKMCGKSFVLKRQLTLHSRVHLSGKPYKCNVCGRKYKSLLKLSAHKSIHIGEKPHDCDLCVNSYSSVGELAYHRSTCHHGVHRNTRLSVGGNELSITVSNDTREKPKFTYGAKRGTPRPSEN